MVNYETTKSKYHLINRRHDESQLHFIFIDRGE